jgi:hypothetical protein
MNMHTLNGRHSFYTPNNLLSSNLGSSKAHFPQVIEYLVKSRIHVAHKAIIKIQRRFYVVIS